MTQTAASVTVARTVEEVEALRETWDRLTVTNVDADIDYFLTLVEHDPGVIRPHVLRVHGADGDDVLVVARVVRESFPLKLGYRRITEVPMTTIVVSFDGVVGAGDNQALAVVAGAFREALRAGEADAVLFQQIRLEDPVRAHIEGTFRRWQRARKPVVVRWTAALPGSWEEFLAQRSSKSRRQIRADDSKFTRKYPDRFEVRRLDKQENKHLADIDMEEVARKSYQRALGVGSDGNPRQKALMALASRQGWLRVWMLYVDQAPVAFWWGLAYSRVLTIGSPGFDPAYAKDRVGYFTMRRMIEDLCSDPDVSVLDFGHGDADYKARFGTASVTSSDILVFAARARPLAVNALVSLNALVNKGALALLERSGLADGLKRAWKARRVRAVSGEPGASDRRAPRTTP